MLVSPIRSLARGLGLGVVLLAAASGLARAGAVEADSPVVAAFGNTVTTTYPDGKTQEIWLHPDGTWAGLSRTHRELTGTWTLKGDRVCMRQRTPPTLPLSYCTAFPQGARIGAVWASKDFGGTPIRLKLVRGVQTAS